MVFALELAQAREDSSNRASPKSPMMPIPVPMPEDERDKDKEKKEKEDKEEKEAGDKEIEKSLTPIPTEPEDEEKEPPKEEPPKEEPMEEITTILSPRQRRMNRLSLSLVNTDFDIDSPRKSNIMEMRGSLFTFT